jgi:hypothetical protein
MSKYKYKHHWNYRIITKIIPAEIGSDLKGNSTLIHDDYREFSIVEVHYGKGKPQSYSGSKSILEYESKKDLKKAYKRIKSAFKKPVLDADNWPNKWKNYGRKNRIHQSF